LPPSSETRRHLALVGATASGKTQVALAVARALGDVEIVSADSMQVYRGMDIGTAKPSAAEQAEIRHHLLDVVEPTEEFTVTRFQAEVARAIEGIEGIEARGQRALLVGGTGLYVQAVVDGLDVPGQWPGIRAELEAAADAHGTQPLHGRLGVLDPVAASRMLPSNRRRVVRALEVTLGSGRPFSSFGPGLQAYPATSFRLAGLAVPAAVTATRIEARYAEQVRCGFLEEVRALPPLLSRTARQALGYRELLAHLSGERTLEEALLEAAARTRRFARRQRAWFRRDGRIGWHDAGGNPLDAVPGLLRDWR